jgi:hypothetical protein
VLLPPIAKRIVSHSEHKVNLDKKARRARRRASLDAIVILTVIIH